jgi:hypothetical protein
MRTDASGSRLSVVLLSVAAVLVCSAPGVFATDAGDEGGAAAEPVLTNRDLPSLAAMDASEPGLPEPTPVGSSGPKPVRLAPAEAGGARGPVTADEEQMTVPELLDELERLRKREMRMLVPFLSRRFAPDRPEEREAERGLEGLARYAKVERELAEIRNELSARGVEPPQREFGQPAPLVETDITQSPPVITDISAGPGYPTERVSETNDPAKAGFKVFYDLDELAAPVTRETFGDGRPAPLFSGDFDEVPVVRPR